MANLIQSLIEVPPGTDPDRHRRQWLLNVILAGTFVLSVMEIMATTVLWITGVMPGRTTELYATGAAALVMTVILYIMNRYGPAWLASTLFLIISTSIIVAFEDPAEVADGRSILVFMLPVAVSAMLLKPWITFVAAFASSATVTLLAIYAQILPNPFAMLLFFAMAIISWLSARNLESTLSELRTLNVDLDQRVDQRTGELSAILDSTADGIIVFDKDGRITRVNPALADQVGYFPDELIGQNIEQLMEKAVNPTDHDLVLNLLQRRKMEKPSVKIEWHNKTFSVSVAPVLLESEQEIGTVAVFRDFTLEAQIDRMKSTFVGIASHELRTPLNAIMGYVEMLHEGIYGELSARQEDALKRVLANTYHMHSLAGNLLDQAQIESGTMALNLTQFPPGEVVQEAVLGTEVLAAAKQLSLTSEVSPDLPKLVTGDRQRLSQVVVNLIGNAIKFTTEGGIHVSAQAGDGKSWYAIAIVDTGIGIPEEAQEYVFEPFRRADDATVEEYGGVGLGLSIVKQLVEMMGGRVELESEVGKGSTFTIVLPTAIEKAAADA